MIGSGRLSSLCEVAALLALMSLAPACGILEPDRPSAQVLEDRIAKCMDIDPAHVNVNWSEDGTALSVGTSSAGFDGAGAPGLAGHCIDAAFED